MLPHLEHFTAEKEQGCIVALLQLITQDLTASATATLEIKYLSLHQFLSYEVHFLHRICQVVMFGTYYKLYSIKSAQREVLGQDFINV